MPEPDSQAATPRDTIYAIGDVHGCYGLLIDLLDRIVADIDHSNIGSTASLVFLGDYIDRGPASAEVIAALVWLQRHSPVPTIFLKGNHEQVMLDYLADPVEHAQWFRFGGRATLRSYGLELAGTPSTGIDHLELRDRIVDRLPSSHLEFLRNLQLFHETEHFVFVHAGVRASIPLAKQTQQDLLWIREGFLEEQRAGTKRVVHGHSWTDDKPQILAHRVGIDTGGFRTGVLTAAKISGEAVDFISTVSQDAGAAHKQRALGGV